MVWLFKICRLSAALTLLPASVLFGMVTSSLKFKFLLLECIQVIYLLCVLKFEYALLVRTICDVFEIV